MKNSAFFPDLPQAPQGEIPCGIIPEDSLHFLPRLSFPRLQHYFRHHLSFPRLFSLQQAVRVQAAWAGEGDREGEVCRLQ